MRSPEKHTQEILNKLKSAIETSYGTIEGRRHILTISDVSFGAIPPSDDYAMHKEILLNQETAGVDYFANVELMDKTSKSVLDKKSKMRLGKVPIVTNRHSFIIKGKEYIVHNQVRLRPGIYTKLDRNENPVADFNLAKGSNMSIEYAPHKSQLQVAINGNHVPLYTILKDVYNVPDVKLSNELGQDIHGNELSKYLTEKGKHLEKLHGAVFKNYKDIKTPVGFEAQAEEIKKAFDKTVMEPEVNKMTVGKPYTKVTPDALIHGASDVMKIYRNQKSPTWKDSLAFKSVMGTEDFLAEKFIKKSNEVKNRMKPKIDNAQKISEIMIPYYFNSLLDEFFIHSDLVNYPLQVNPMEMLENAHKITALGEGAIGSTESLPLDARNIHSSYLGFIDPVRTPDNLRAGVDNRVSLFATKRGNTLVTVAWDKAGKPEEVTPEILFNHVYSFKEEPPGINGKYRAFYKGEMVEVDKDKIDYFLKGGNQFTVTSVSIPFLEATHPQRAAMGSKMLTQALSLKNREIPLVTTEAFNKYLSQSYIPKSPVSGKITKILPDTIHIKETSSGKEHVVNVPNKFPLNYHSYLDFQPNVKVGDSIEKGQLLGDHNFSTGGQMALGLNARVAFIPYKGYNYEDAVVVTEQGAKKMTSNHIFQEEIQIPPNGSVIVDSRKFAAYFPHKFTVSQLGTLQDGVVKRGDILHSGDPIITALKSKRESPEVLTVGRMTSRISNPFNDVSLVWDKDYPGTVIEVKRLSSAIRVIIQAEAPIQVGDKLCNRYGGKGVVSLIVPDNEAPYTMENGKKVIPDVLLNPAGLPSRKNVSQVFETQIAKVMKATGQKQFVQKPMTEENLAGMTMDMLNKAGLKETSNYVDPKTGKIIPNIHDGYQYFLKLFKQTEGNFASRASGDYDIDLRPIKGGQEGAKAVGALEFYGILAHHKGNRALLRDMATYKAEYNPEMWQALLTGKPLPPPKSTFTFEKLKTMMQGAGINIKKEGNSLKLLPFTDKDILGLSNGAIHSSDAILDKPDPITGLPFRPIKNGIFDPAVTGGLAGKQWAHVPLVAPVLNPAFERPARILLGLTKDKMEGIIHGNETLKIDGEELSGGHAIKKALGKIDRDSMINELENELPKTKSQMKKDGILKKLKYLRALKKQEMTPQEAYTIENIPIIPPVFRPVYPDETGTIIVSDINHIYKSAIDLNNSLKGPLAQASGRDSHIYRNLHGELYNQVKKIQGLDKGDEQNERDPKGFLKTIIGSGQVKYGYFQNKLLSRTQDLTGRGTVIPDPSYDIDTLGIPEPMAWGMYGSHVIGEMVKNGYTLEKAAEAVEKRAPAAKNLLLAEMNKRPITMKRDPVLHKFGVMAFKPKLVTGKNIRVCPLIVGGFGMDYDGDTAVTHIPVTAEAVQDTYNMLPSNNLFNPLNRSPMHKPGQESIIGLYHLSKPIQASPVKKFKTKDEAVGAYNAGTIGVNDHIEIESV